MFSCAKSGCKSLNLSNNDFIQALIATKEVLLAEVRKIMYKALKDSLLMNPKQNLISLSNVLPYIAGI